MEDRLKNHELGSLGEDIVASSLKDKGINVVARNFRSRYGEIDIVARDGPDLVFIEVKTRRTGRCGAPEESVGYRKQKKLRLMALHYIGSTETRFHGCRFDVYSVYLDEQNRLQKIVAFENCF